MTAISQGATLSNVDSKDIVAIQYDQIGLGAGTVSIDPTDGRTYRDYYLDVRYTAGGTLSLTIEVSGEDVAFGSVSTWHPATKLLVDANTGTTIATATVTASGYYIFRTSARWVRVTPVLTGTGNSLAIELGKGWG